VRLVDALDEKIKLENRLISALRTSAFQAKSTRFGAASVAA
jgi:hypothetical protein